MCVYFSVVPLSATHRDSHQAVCCAVPESNDQQFIAMRIQSRQRFHRRIIEISNFSSSQRVRAPEKSDVGDLQWRISVFCIPICCVWCLCRITQLYSNKFRCSDFLWRHFDGCSRRFDGLQANCSTHEWIREISSTTTSSSMGCRIVESCLTQWDATREIKSQNDSP